MSTLTPGGIRTFTASPDDSYLASLDAEYSGRPELPDTLRELREPE